MTDHKANAEALDIALYGKPDIYTPPEDFMPRRATITAKLAELYPDRDAVDHKAEAERLIKFAEGNGSVSAATAAVAEATLAVAEQQHTALLLAWISLPSDFTCDETVPFDKTYAAPVTQRNNVRRTIREGLGLS